MTEQRLSSDPSHQSLDRPPMIAIVSLIFGFLSLGTGFLGGIPAIICGHLSLAKIRKNDLKNGKGLAVFGLIMGYFMTVFSPPIPFLGASKAMAAAKNAEALNTVYNFRNAIAAYYTEYRRVYPIGDGESGALTDAKFMAGLLGIDSELGTRTNPRGIVFFSGRVATRTDYGKWQRGISFDKTGSGDYWDPWGNLYRVKVEPGVDPIASVRVWSPGPDGIDGTGDDLMAE